MGGRFKTAYVAMTQFERRSAIVGLVLLAILVITYMVVFPVRDTTSSTVPVVLLLGVAYVAGYTRIILPRRQGATTFNIREASYSLALIGGEPHIVIPVLLLFRIHQWWLTGVSMKWRLLTMTTGLEAIIIQVWLFHYLGILAAPANVTVSTVLQAAPALAVGAVVGFVVFCLVHPSRAAVDTAKMVSLPVAANGIIMSWLASMIGVVLFLPGRPLVSEALTTGGPLLLLVLAIVVALQQFNRSKHWTNASRLVSNWEMTPAQLKQTLKSLHRLSSVGDQILLVEDRATGGTLRAWTSMLGLRQHAGRVDIPLAALLQQYPTSGTAAKAADAWNLPKLGGWMTAEIAHQRVALIQVSTCVRVNLLPAVPHNAANDLPLPVEALLEDLCRGIERYELERMPATDLASMLQNLTEGLAIVGPDRRVRAWNAALARLTGVPAEQAIAGSLDDHIRDSGISIGDGTPPLMLTTRPDGSAAYLLTTLSEVTVEDELSTIHMFRDVTETFAAAESRGQFFAYAAHEMKTPISSLYLQLGDLEDRLGEDDTLVEGIRAAVGQLSGTLSDIATASELHLDQANLPTAGGRVKASQLIDFAWLNQTRHIHPQLTVRQEQDFHGQIDVLRAHQVLTNLIGNAIKFSPQGAEIQLEYGVNIGKKEGYFQVADVGVGVPEASRSRLFEPYFRGANTATAPGSGLGLSLSRHLARQMGGNLTYEPRESGLGSTFTLWVKLVDDDSETERQLAS